MQEFVCIYYIGHRYVLGDQVPFCQRQSYQLVYCLNLSNNILKLDFYFFHYSYCKRLRRPSTAHS